jgi:hypothetical protein
MPAIGTRTGVGGSVTIPSGFGLPEFLILKAFRWQETVTRQALPDTDFATTDNAEEVIGGQESVTYVVECRADRADYVSMSSIASAITNTNEQPVASLVLQEGYIGTSSTAIAKTTVTALLTGVDRTIVKGATVDYRLTFTRSGPSEHSAA